MGKQKLIKTAISIICLTICISSFVFSIDGLAYMPVIQDASFSHFAEADQSDVFDNNPPHPLEKPWWNSEWTHSERITVDHLQVEEDLVNFPLLLWVASDDLKQAQPDGDDFVFVQSDNETVLSHEIERFNVSSGELIAWINIPVLSSTQDTIFYIYFGNPDCDSQQQIQTTWNTEYLGVYHLNQKNQSLFDSAYTQNATRYEDPGPVYQQLGKIGYSIEFGGDRGGGYFLFDNDAYKLKNQDVTVAAWVYLEKDKNSDDTIIYLGQSSTYWGPWPHICLKKLKNSKNEGKVLFQYGNDPQNVSQVLSNKEGPALLDQWLYIVGVINYTGNKTTLFINGVQQNQTDRSVEYDLQISDLYFTSAMAYDGMGSEDNWNYLSGRLDEIRISQSARSSAWIQTAFNNMQDPKGFCIYGKGYTISTNTDGYGTIQKTPDRSTYAAGTEVELTANPDQGWIFEFWTGDLTGTHNPESLLMDDNKHVIAQFLDIEKPHITDVQSQPNNTTQEKNINISCNATDNHYLNIINTVITYPDNTTQNMTMNHTASSHYYFNQTYNQVGVYTYKIWTNDRSGNQNTSPAQEFTIKRNPRLNNPPRQPTEEQPTNNTAYHTIYNVTLRVNVSDPDEDALNVTFFWGNHTQIATLESIPHNSTAQIFLPDYLDPDWLEHNTNHSWYVTVSDGITDTASPLWFFTTSKAWDVNEDRTINYLDMSALSSKYGESVTPGSIGSDVNNDGKINYLDISALSSHYGESY